ncbi:MAG: hypothetical protein NTV21_02420 [Planctomycetota bacterium]|nr:hypothetical protein [Planctomycetota bacterium]
MAAQAEPRRLGASLALVALFAASATLATLALRRLLPGGGAAELVDAKLARFSERKDELTVVFLGSSRVHRGFVPQVFDARTAAAGVATRSFNLGAPGSRAFEVEDLLARLVDLAPAQLDYVFVDPEGVALLRDERNELARQVIEWHDPDATLRLSRWIVGSGLRGMALAQALTPHWRSCAYNVSNIGRSQLWVDLALGRPRTPELERELVGPALDGYAPLGDENSELGRRGQRFQKRREAYLEKLEEFRRLEAKPGPADPFALELYGEIRTRIDELGAAPVFVTQPALYRQDDLAKAAEAGLVPRLMRFDDAERWPELYAPENRYDDTHLNDAGARLFTERLADEFLARVKSGELKAP